MAELYYGRQVITVDNLLMSLARYYGVFGEEWDELLSSTVRAGQPLVPLLAGESAVKPAGHLSLGVSDAVLLLNDLRREGDTRARAMRCVFERLSREEATLIWSRALGEWPAISRRRFMRAIAKMTDYEADHLNRSCRFHGVTQTVRRALLGDLPGQYRLEPGHPFEMAVYTRWTKWSPPFEQTCYELVRGSRAVLHASPDGQQVYRRTGERWFSHPPVEGEVDEQGFIAEVEHRGNVLHITDILHTSDDPERWRRGYVERAIEARAVRDDDHLLDLLRGVDDHMTLRLLDATAPYFDENGLGGHIAPKSLFELPLLLMRVRAENGTAEVELGALDGYEPVRVGFAECDAQILNVPRMSGLLIPRWRDVTEQGTVLVCGAHDFEGGELKSPNVMRLDGSLGISDVIQMGDLLSLSDGRR